MSTLIRLRFRPAGATPRAANRTQDDARREDAGGPSDRAPGRSPRIDDENPWLQRDAAPWHSRLLALVVALLVTGPTLAPGFVLVNDMVFVPRQDLDLDALGLGGALPRAVPVDAVMGVLTTVVPGQLVQKFVLVGLVYAAVLGAARLVPVGRDGRRGLAAVVSGLAYGWSPYLAERLLLGQWTHLLAFAALPWIARAALRLRAGAPDALPVLVLTVVPAALSPSGALLAGGVVVAVLGRRCGPALGVLLVLSLPWITAGLLHPEGAASDPSGVAAFAARAENWAGRRSPCSAPAASGTPPRCRTVAAPSPRPWSRSCWWASPGSAGCGGTRRAVPVAACSSWAASACCWAAPGRCRDSPTCWSSRSGRCRGPG